MRSMMVVGVLLCAMVAGGSCCWAQPCGCGACDAGCAPCDTYCGPACGPCAPCGDGCGCGLLAPVRWVFGVLGFNCSGACNGCGPVYCGDWCDSPPDCCDPCDQCGNYIGRQGPYLAPGPYVGQVYAGKPRTAASVASRRPAANRPVAAAPRKMVPMQASQQISGEPRIIAETDEVVEQPASPAAWQTTRAPHLAPARR